jgi:DNA (cytosine-5)-methyltransferase 1
MLRIVGEVSPQFVLSENVARRAIETAATGLRSLGYQTSAVALSAADVGGDHIRRRFWLLGHADNNGKPNSAINAEASWVPRPDHRVWAGDPDITRIPDGVAHRMDRIRAIGNGQVPIVAALAWRILTCDLNVGGIK